MAVSNDAENALARVSEGRLCIPDFKLRSYLCWRNRVSRTILRRFPGFYANILPEIIGDSALFLMGVDLALNGFLSSPRSRKWIYLYDAPESAWVFLERKFHTWRNIGCLYLSSSQAAAYFQEKLNFPVQWLPQASTYKYIALKGKYKELGREKIILNIGRPNKALGEFFRWFSEKHGFHFITQDTTEGILFSNREEFLSILNNSAIAVVHPRNIDHPDEMGCVSMLTARYYEAYQSGAVVAGFRPVSGEFEKIFSGYPFVEMHAWSSFQDELICELDQKSKWLAIARQARVKHCWENRVKEIFNDIKKAQS